MISSRCVDIVWRLSANGPCWESVSPVAERTPADALSDLSSKNSLRVYWALGLAVGDRIAAGCGARDV
jgi:hypothetical protein